MCENRSKESVLEVNRWGWGWSLQTQGTIILVDENLNWPKKQPTEPWPEGSKGGTHYVVGFRVC